jgi:hypothetical protein
MIKATSSNPLSGYGFDGGPPAGPEALGTALGMGGAERDFRSRWPREEFAHGARARGAGMSARLMILGRFPFVSGRLRSWPSQLELESPAGRQARAREAAGLAQGPGARRLLAGFSLAAPCAAHAAARAREGTAKLRAPKGAGTGGRSRRG